MDQHSIGTPEANPKRSGLRVLVGEPWPGDVRVEIHEGNSRLAFGLSVFLAALLVAYTVYGMATSDDRIHERVLEVIRLSLLAIVSWVFGRGVR